MNAIPTAGEFSNHEERRTSRRRKLERLAYVDFGPDNGGVLLDIGEGGLRFQGVLPMSRGQSVRMKFSVPGISHNGIEAAGEVTWSNISGKGGGLRFMEMAEDARVRLKEWVLDKPLDVIASSSADASHSTPHLPDAVFSHADATNDAATDAVKAPAQFPGSFAASTAEAVDSATTLHSATTPDPATTDGPAILSAAATPPATLPSAGLATSSGTATAAQAATPPETATPIVASPAEVTSPEQHAVFAVSQSGEPTGTPLPATPPGAAPLLSATPSMSIAPASHDAQELTSHDAPASALPEVSPAHMAESSNRTLESKQRLHEPEPEESASARGTFRVTAGEFAGSIRGGKQETQTEPPEFGTLGRTSRRPFSSQTFPSAGVPAAEQPAGPPPNINWRIQDRRVPRAPAGQRSSNSVVFTVAILAAACCFAVLSAIVGTRVFGSQPGLQISGAKQSAKQAAFQVEVVDASNKRWTLTDGNGANQARSDNQPARSQARTNVAATAAPVENPVDTRPKSANVPAGRPQLALQKPRVASSASTPGRANNDAAAPIAAPSISAELPARDITIGTAAPPEIAGRSRTSTFEPPVLISRVEPAYPVDAIRQRLEGAVTVRATIGKDGAPRMLKVERGDPRLSPAALAVLPRWRYKPALLNGEPAEAETLITVSFNLRK